MVEKRKLPARAASRAEQPPAKRRNITPSEPSLPPAVVESPKDPGPPPLPPLPKSVQAGKPLPTVETAQPDDLSDKEYQSVGESGVLAESLSRSRSKWTNEGLFEKYWTKPYKRKGVIIEGPDNPSKDSMMRVGNVTIHIEPHIIEAVLYSVKCPPQPRSEAQTTQQQQQARPILQYGPPNSGTNPSSATPGKATASPALNTPAQDTTGASTSKAVDQSVATDSDRPVPSHQEASTTIVPPAPTPKSTGTPLMAPPPPPPPSTSPPPNLRATPTPLRQSGLVAPFPPTTPSPSTSLAKPSLPPPTTPISHTTASSTAPKPAVEVVGKSPNPAGSSATPTVAMPQPQPGTGKPAAPAAKPSPDDPVIALLAERASKDENLRNLMKKVAIGQAKDAELVHFQKIIDQLNLECKAKQAAQGAPSTVESVPADKLWVDGRTVKYFAGEVKAILDIVLLSNPGQKSTDLRPPPRSDPLVVLLVKTAMEDQRTKDIIRRISENLSGPRDGVDLKEIIERLRKDMKPAPKPAANIASPAAASVTPVPGQVKSTTLQTTSQSSQPQNAQALRSKGPPPTPKPDISAVVFDFGNGDRFLFPKYSILEFVPCPTGQQVVASFLIVRKGSLAEHGGDPELDYYQPVTIRLFIPQGRYLEALARVVAPQDEVRRYMDDVMDNMTRSEFLLLAMRLPRLSSAEKDKDEDKEVIATKEIKANVSTPKSSTPDSSAVAKPTVLWDPVANTMSRTLDTTHSLKLRRAEEDDQAQYQRLIQSVTATATEAV